MLPNLSPPSEDILPDLSPVKMSKSERCAVCGKPAFCYNYAVLTCNACKMFFRRIEVEKVTYTCNFRNKCYQKPDDFRSSKCKSCRFKRCLLAGMKYIPPGKPEFRSSKDDLLNGLISDLLFLDTRRRHKFLNFYTSEDPTLLEMLERPKGAMVLKAEDMEMDPHEWSFLGIYTSIESFLSLEFVDQLLIKDKAILIHNYAVKSMLLTSGKRTVDEKRDKIVTPDKRDVYPDSLYNLLSVEFLHRIRTCLVARLIELKITQEEYVLINIILFCNTALSNLSSDALSLISSHQKIYTNVLLQYCFLNYQRSGPARFSDLLSLCHVINRNFEDVQYLTTLIQIYMPSLKLKKLFIDLMKSLE